MEEQKIQALTADGKLGVLVDGEWKVDGASEAPENDADINTPKAFKSKPQRTRKFCITSYIDPTSLEAFVTSSPWIQHWAMATHDKDLEESGEVKKTHTHLLLYTYDAKTSTAVKKIFDRFSNLIYSGTDTPPQNTRVQNLHDVVHQWRYLIHLDETDPNQYHYDPQDRICDNFSYWHNLELSQTMTASDNNKALAMFDDFLAKTPTRVMLERYGNAYLYHIQHLEKAKQCYYRDIGVIAKDKPGDLLRIAIEGSSYSEQYKQIFFTMLNYVEEQSLILYGDALRLGLVEDTKKGKRYESNT